ncbi:hypothetical protein RFN29_13385 [Mesorhizobium sp. VK22B]|uniref:Uncharacterized protein n=1 Tax=Mesorhizobium captivum TaxID=3072319 RepID=A0ABU4Z014_9HYPH|nr:hypothetical protein [Mesorhizobium sp. VK22B]MDX8492569.1 hypothetical protein [Mesorhizobium sp. VK22B]
MSFSLAGQAVDGQACAGFELFAERVFNEWEFHRHGDPREMEGRRTGSAYMFSG